MAEDKKNTGKKAPVKLDPNRNDNKTFAQVRKETFDGISEIISKDEGLQDRNISFRTETNKAGDLEYHMYEDANPNDTNPARLTGIFTQDQMDEAIQARKDDSFYAYDESKQVEKTPKVSDDDPDMSIGGSTSRGTSSASLYAVVNGIITTIDL
jgi:hypothetical protein